MRNSRVNPMPGEHRATSSGDETKGLEETDDLDEEYESDLVEEYESEKSEEDTDSSEENEAGDLIEDYKKMESFENQDENVETEKRWLSDDEEQVADIRQDRHSTKKSIFFISEELQEALNEIVFDENIRKCISEYIPRRQRSSSTSLDISATNIGLPIKIGTHGRSNSVMIRAMFNFILNHVHLIIIFITLLLVVLVVSLLCFLKSEYTKFEIFVISFPGHVFVRMIGITLGPLVVISTITATVRSQLQLTRHLLWRFVLYHLVTSAIAIMFAVVITQLIEPGRGVTFDKQLDFHIIERAYVLDSIVASLRNFLPDNIVAASIYSLRNRVIYKGEHLIDDVLQQKNLLGNSTNWQVKEEIIYHPNFLGLVTFGLSIGLVLRMLQDHCKMIVRVLYLMELVLLQIAVWFFRFAAIGNFFLLIDALLSLNLHNKYFFDYYLYMVTVLITTVVHTFCGITLYFYYVTEDNPFIYIKQLSWLIFLGFASASSLHTMPALIIWLDKVLKLDKSAARLAAATSCVSEMEGLIISMTVSSLFILQAVGQKLSLWNLSIICLNVVTFVLKGTTESHEYLTAAAIGLVYADIPLGDSMSIARNLFLFESLVSRVRSALGVLNDAMSAVILHNATLFTLEKSEEAMKEIQMNLINESRRISKQKEAILKKADPQQIRFGVVEDDLELTSVTSV